MATFEAETVDDLLNNVLSALGNLPFDGNPTRAKEGGSTSEMIGGSLKLKNPRARLSRTETRSTLFTALGELLWYLSKTNSLDFISHYIRKYNKEAEDGKIWGGYGPRLFSLNEKHNQVENIIQLLGKRPETRRAVIQVFDGEDLLGDPEHKDIL